MLNTLPDENFDLITACSSDQNIYVSSDAVFFHSLLVLSVSQVVENDAITITDLKILL